MWTRRAGRAAGWCGSERLFRARALACAGDLAGQASLRAVEATGREIGRELAPEGECAPEESCRRCSRRSASSRGGRSVAGGLTYRLCNCPYRDAVRESPEVVCALHRGMTRGLLDVIAPETELAGFVPLDPYLAGCRIELARRAGGRRAVQPACGSLRNVLALLLVAGSLGLNNLAASIAIGLSGVDRATRTRTALAFGLFEAGMPVVGLLIGRQVSHALGGAANTVGGLLPIAVGAQVAVSAVRSPHDSRPPVSGAGMGSISSWPLLSASTTSSSGSRSALTAPRSSSASRSSRPSASACRCSASSSARASARR